MVTAGAVAAAVLLGITACAPAGTVSAANATAGVTASSSATAMTPDAVLSATPASPVAPTSAAPVPQAQQWRTFSSAGGKVSFDYPAQWTVTAPPGASGSSAVDVDVTDAQGMVVASLHYGPSGGIGGACQGPVPYTVLDSVELALPYNTYAADTITPRFAFRALQEAGRVTASYGITSSVAGKDGKSCMFYNVVSGPAESPLYSFADAFQVNVGGSEQNGNRKGAKSFPSLEEARAYMQSSEYLNAKRMITSLKIDAG
ncbi:hypothetical protein E5206_15815 [Arthrobacter sp. PAMC25564]|uniref:hypothetical protein n=1 Tax=Arthrobacter sp. PAMC25564 TaxID=2565366 RepID=UPI0010A22183|nr:hypothetical protein [Arthrobacter sp. PAMC25564]QCB98200.1 hypothetical protein E5206_15815 [Arthrobacter sp. PAMC25564]